MLIHFLIYSIKIAWSRWWHRTNTHDFKHCVNHARFSITAIVNYIPTVEESCIMWNYKIDLEKTTYRK